MFYYKGALIIVGATCLFLGITLYILSNNNSNISVAVTKELQEIQEEPQQKQPNLVCTQLEPLTQQPPQGLVPQQYVMSQEKRKEYMEKGVYPNYIPQGWIEAPSSAIAYWVGNLQERYHMAGSIGEIGVHHGKFFIALALMARVGETLWAVDLFESLQHLNVDGSGKGSLVAFKKALTHYGLNPSHVKIHAKSSLDLTNEDFKGVPCFRLFSIDGGHTAKTTLHDLCIVEQIVCEGGVVTIDDYSNTLWPGVYTGYAQYALNPSSKLAPFYWGHNKIWLATKDYHTLYYTEMAKIAPSTGNDKLFGWDVRQGKIY